MPVPEPPHDAPLPPAPPAVHVIPPLAPVPQPAGRRPRKRRRVTAWPDPRPSWRLRLAAAAFSLSGVLQLGGLAAFGVAMLLGAEPQIHSKGAPLWAIPPFVVLSGASNLATGWLLRRRHRAAAAIAIGAVVLDAATAVGRGALPIVSVLLLALLLSAWRELD